MTLVVVGRWLTPDSLTHLTDWDLMWPWVTLSFTIVAADLHPLSVNLRDDNADTFDIKYVKQVLRNTALRYTQPTNEGRNLTLLWAKRTDNRNMLRRSCACNHLFMSSTSFIHCPQRIAAWCSNSAGNLSHIAISYLWRSSAQNR